MRQQILQTWTGQMGEEKPIAVIASHILNVDLSLSTATFEIWDEAGNRILDPTNATVNGTTRLEISYQVDLSGNAEITEAGNFRGIFRHNFGSAIEQVQIPMQILARPA